MKSRKLGYCSIRPFLNALFTVSFAEITSEHVKINEHVNFEKEEEKFTGDDIFGDSSF